MDNASNFSNGHIQLSKTKPAIITTDSNMYQIVSTIYRNVVALAVIKRDTKRYEIFTRYQVKIELKTNDDNLPDSAMADIYSALPGISPIDRLSIDRFNGTTIDQIS